jgi:hypothetical protein
MPLIPPKLSFLPEFDGRDRLYSSLFPENRGGKFTLRILTILPNDDHLAPIEASLNIEALHLDLEYIAISYYWGDVNALEYLTIRGSDEGVPGLVCKLPVTKNLVAALRQFRTRASVNKEPLQLWIDAVCINQTDAVERAIQVGMMERIFQIAKNVWIWLGESDELVASGLATLFDLTDFHTLAPLQGTFSVRRATTRSRCTSWTLSLDEEILYIKQLSAVCALPYWSRGWTFQETVQPQRHVRYGKLKIELRSWYYILELCYQYVERMGKKLQALSFLPDILPLLSTSEKAFLLESLDINKLVSTFAPFAYGELEYLKKVRNFITRDVDEFRAANLTQEVFDSEGLFQARFLQDTFYLTSDPRDSVFALREIIPSLDKVRLDYAETPEYVFSAATEIMLRTTRAGLRELHKWYHPQTSPQPPSWVFDFTHCSIDIDENGTRPWVSRTLIAEFDASAGSFVRVSHCTRASIHVAGFLFDEILDISLPVDNTLQPHLRPMALWCSWMELARLHFRKRVTAEQESGAFTRALLRTFVLGHTVKGRFDLADLGLPDSVHWEDGPLVVLKAIIKLGNSVGAATGNCHTEAIAFTQALKRSSQCARFFVTKSFRVGLALPGAAVGDQIAILASGSLPFVLRPVPEDYAGEEAYRIMGGCYVDGMVTRITTFARHTDQYSQVRCKGKPCMQKPFAFARRAKASCPPERFLSRLALRLSRIPLAYGARKRQWSWLLHRTCASSKGTRFMRKKSFA